MTYDAAVALYLKGNSVARRVIGRIVGWDENATVAANCKALDFSQPVAASVFARRFGLSYLRKNRKALIPIEAAEVRRLREQGFSHARIGLLYGTSRQNIEQVEKSRGKVARSNGAPLVRKP